MAVLLWVVSQKLRRLVRCLLAVMAGNAGASRDLLGSSSSATEVTVIICLDGSETAGQNQREVVNRAVYRAVGLYRTVG